MPLNKNNNSSHKNMINFLHANKLFSKIIDLKKLKKNNVFALN